MKKILLALIVFLSFFAATSQTIKFKMTGITTATDGEDVVAFETSDTINVVSAGGGGSSIGKVMFEPIKIKKLQDVSTNELFIRSILGTHSPDATFEFYKADVLFYKIVIKDIILTHFSYLSPECFNCAKLFHQVWFYYNQIEVTDVATGNVTKYDRKAGKSY